MPEHQPWPGCLRCDGPCPPRPRTHCDACRNALWQANRRLSWALAFRLLRGCHRLRSLLRDDDAKQAADLGLLLACGRWEPSRGALSTAAHYCVRRALQEEAAWGGRAAARVTVDAGRGGPVKARLSAKARAAARPPLSLDREVAGAPRLDDGHPDTYGSLLPARPARRPEPDEATLGGELSGLPPREAEALRLRLGEGLTLREAGLRMGITKERVRQLCNKGLARLRVSMGVTAS